MASDCRSTSKRCREVASKRPLLIILSATRRRKGAICSASQTCPMPPSPSLLSKRYLPIEPKSRMGRAAAAEASSVASASPLLSDGWKLLPEGSRSFTAASQQVLDTAAVRIAPKVGRWSQFNWITTNRGVKNRSTAFRAGILMVLDRSPCVVSVDAAQDSTDRRAQRMASYSPASDSRGSRTKGVGGTLLGRAVHLGPSHRKVW